MVISWTKQMKMLPIQSKKLLKVTSCKSFTIAHIEYYNENEEKGVEYAKNQFTYNEKKQKKYKPHSGTKSQHISFDLDALSSSNSDDNCFSSSLGRERGGINHQWFFILKRSVLRTLNKNVNKSSFFVKLLVVGL